MPSQLVLRLAAVGDVFGRAENADDAGLGGTPDRLGVTEKPSLLAILRSDRDLEREALARQEPRARVAQRRDRTDVEERLPAIRAHELFQRIPRHPPEALRRRLDDDAAVGVDA